MNIQEKKEYLARYRVMEADIGQISEELGQWRARAVRMAVLFSDKPAGVRAQARTQVAVRQIAVIEERLDRSLEELVKAMVEIEKTIISLQDPTLRRLFKFRYISGHTWEKIAEELGYSLRHVTRLHKRALEMLRL